MPLRRIALLGARGTGKTQLAAELAPASTGPTPTGFFIADNPALADVLQPQRFDLALLMGLDLPVPNTGASAHAHREAHEREAADQYLRQALADGRVPYRVVYGQGPARLRNAWGALQGLLSDDDGVGSAPQTRGGGQNAAWVWACDTCSDPDCERRLFSSKIRKLS